MNTTYTPTPNAAELGPRHLYTSAAYRYCIREIYLPSAAPAFATPLEYTFVPSDYHLFLDAESVYHAEDIWLQAVKFFPNN